MTLSDRHLTLLERIHAQLCDPVPALLRAAHDHLDELDSYLQEQTETRQDLSEAQALAVEDARALRAVLAQLEAATT